MFTKVYKKLWEQYLHNNLAIVCAEYFKLPKFFDVCELITSFHFYKVSENNKKRNIITTLYVENNMNIKCVIHHTERETFCDEYTLGKLIIMIIITILVITKPFL